MNKNDQIEAISTLKTLIHSYVNDEEKITRILSQRIQKLSNYLIFNKGAMGIRVSTYLAILQPKKYASISLLISSNL